jgi:hypothetical protein
MRKNFDSISDARLRALSIFFLSSKLSYYFPTSLAEIRNQDPRAAGARRGGPRAGIKGSEECCPSLLRRADLNTARGLRPRDRRPFFANPPLRVETLSLHLFGSTTETTAVEVPGGAKLATSATTAFHSGVAATDLKISGLSNHSSVTI